MKLHRNSVHLPAVIAIVLLAAPVAGQPRDVFNGATDPSVIDKLTAATPPSHTAPYSGGSLKWENVAIEDRGAGKVYEKAAIAINFAPKFSYESGPDMIMTVLGFNGTATFAAGRAFKIEQDNVGPFFARALFGREERVVKFLLPSMFTNLKSGQHSFGILAFDCETELTSCAAPRLVFSSLLEKHDRSVLGPAAGLKAREISVSVSESNATQKTTLTAGCCLNAETGSCRCKPAPPCPLACEHFYPDTCFDCLEAFLCNC